MSKIAFITEMNFIGEIPKNFTNCRTEFAWMHALNATHYPIHNMQQVANYDKVFVIFPKGKTFLSAEGTQLSNEINPVSKYLTPHLITFLKSKNKEVCMVQEGPTWWFTNYELQDQINYVNMVCAADKMFVHNQYDVAFWKAHTKNVFVLPTLMIEETIKNVEWKPQDKTIIGGNFSRWYGGMQSYTVAKYFENPIYTIESHSKRNLEEQLVNHVPRVEWTQWMQQLSEFKYAVHLMPTIAAGTFSLNCAYFGIPCIGNKNVDTQLLCHPLLSVDVDDVYSAVELATKLKEDENFYLTCSKQAKENYRKHYDIHVWKNKLGL